MAEGDRLMPPRVGDRRSDPSAKESGGWPDVHVNVAELVDIESEALLNRKKQLLRSFGDCVFKVNDAWANSLLLPALRVYHFDEREMNAHKAYCLYDFRPFEQRMQLLGRVSPRNEQRCLIYIWKRLFSHQSTLLSPNMSLLKTQLQSMMSSLHLYVYFYSCLPDF